MLLQVPVPLPANTIPDLIVPSHIIVQRCSGQPKIFSLFFLLCFNSFFSLLLSVCSQSLNCREMVRSLSLSFFKKKQFPDPHHCSSKDFLPFIIITTPKLLMCSVIFSVILFISFFRPLSQFIGVRMSPEENQGLNSITRCYRLS